MPDPIHSRLGVHLVIPADALLSSLRHMYSVAGIGLLHGDITRTAAWLPSYHTILTPSGGSRAGQPAGAREPDADQEDARDVMAVYPPRSPLRTGTVDDEPMGLEARYTYYIHSVSVSAEL